MKSDGLVSLCERIGIPRAEIVHAESIDTLSYRARLTARELRQLTASEWLVVASEFGESFNLEIGIEEISPLINIAHGISPVNLQDLYSQVTSSSDDEPFSLHLWIDKRRIIEDLGHSLPSCGVLDYLFFDNLIALLKSPITRLDELLFRDLHTPTVVVVHDRSILCRGPLLAIVGDGELDAFRSNLRPISTSEKRRVDRFRDLADDNLRWIDFRLRNTTPVHFCMQCDDRSVMEALAGQLATLCIIYSANRTTIDNKNLDAVFDGRDGTTKIHLDLDHLPTADMNVVLRWALWVPAEPNLERLSILENVVVRKVSGSSPEENAHAFFRLLPQILEDTRWNYRVFLGDKVNAHFVQERKLADYVAEVAKNTAEAIDTIVKSFTDTLLATIGFVVLTALASLVKGDTQGSIFQLGMYAYAAYVILFPGAYRMFSVLHSYKLLESESEQHLKGYAAALGTDQVQKLAGPIASRRRQFGLWYLITWASIVAIFIFVFVAGSQAPALFASHVTVTPTPGASNTPIATTVSTLGAPTATVPVQSTTSTVAATAMPFVQATPGSTAPSTP